MTQTITMKKHEPARAFVRGTPSISSTPINGAIRPSHHPHAWSTGSVPTSRPKPTSNLVAKYSTGLEDTFLTELHSRPGGNGTAALIDFLRNYEPPLSNWMSHADDEDYGQKGGKWSKLKRIGKKSQSISRPPQQIRLPDSAVSGTTIGGHRHIAISIPLTASPFGIADAPQQRQSAPKSSKPTRSGLVRTYTNEKGVVTVLRTVAEDREGSSPTHYTFSPRQDLDNRDPQVIINQTPRPQQKQVLPARGSSFIPARNHYHMRNEASIDGMLSQHDGVSASTAGPSHQSISESVATDGEDLIISDAQQAMLYGSTAIRMNEQTNKSDQLLRPPLAARKLSRGSVLGDPDQSRPNTPGSARNRKDLVRDRKKRDMEAMRSERQKQQDSKAVNNNLLRQTAPVVTFAPIRTVVNMAPSEVVERPPLLRAASVPMSVPADPNDQFLESPITPTSVKPNHRHSYDDRTSLSRRREWNAARDSDNRARLAKEAARLKAKQLLAAATSSLEDMGVSQIQSDQEIIRLYDAYRDHRLRDMDRRLRRLERNGDVWLRALLPVLDNVYKGMSPVKNVRMASLVSPGKQENFAPSQRRGRHGHVAEGDRQDTGDMPSMQRRSSEKTLPVSGNSENWGSETESDDGSGLSCIEPLMRELASEASRRQRKALAARAYRRDDVFLGS